MRLKAARVFLGAAACLIGIPLVGCEHEPPAQTACPTTTSAAEPADAEAWMTDIQASWQGDWVEGVDEIELGAIPIRLEAENIVRVERSVAQTPQSPTCPNGDTLRVIAPATVVIQGNDLGGSAYLEFGRTIGGEDWGYLTIEPHGAIFDEKTASELEALSKRRDGWTDADAKLEWTLSLKVEAGISWVRAFVIYSGASPNTGVVTSKRQVYVGGIDDVNYEPRPVWLGP